MQCDENALHITVLQHRKNVLVDAGNEGMAELASLLRLEGLDDDGLASGVSAGQQDDDLAGLDATYDHSREGALKACKNTQSDEWPPGIEEDSLSFQGQSSSRPSDAIFLVVQNERVWFQPHHVDVFDLGW